MSTAFDMAHRMAWKAPTVEQLQALLEGYDVLEFLGRGGMGAVYRARQKSLGRMVAIKILRPPQGADDTTCSAQRFENEARLMAQMNHPGIVTVYDYGKTTDGRFFYFVMEFVDGTDLAKTIHGIPRMEPDKAMAIVRDVCDALGYAHDHGIIHRDIKPSNILISAEGQIKVADFGLARIVGPSGAPEQNLTRSNVALGTPDFVAPEVLALEAPDARADIYSVGVMLYQLLTGTIPRGLFKMPSQKRPELDSRLDLVICKAMEHERDDRYQSTQEITKALTEIYSDESPKPEMPVKKKWKWIPAALIAGIASVAGMHFLNRRSAEDGTTVPPAVRLDDSVVEINDLPVNRGNIAALGAVSCLGDTCGDVYYPTRSADGRVSGGTPGRATFEDSVHTIFSDFGPPGAGPFSDVANELVLSFAQPVNLVELAAYVSSSDQNGPEDADRVVSSVGFWIDNGNGLNFIDAVHASDSDDVGGFDRVSLAGDWQNVAMVVFTFEPLSTAMYARGEVRVAEIIAIENPDKEPSDPSARPPVD